MKKIFYIFILLQLVSCNVQKKYVDEKKTSLFDNVQEENLFKAIEIPFNFQNLKIKANASIESGTSYPAVSLNLYIDKGKQVWMNASLILPLARASITPDGFKMYERLNKTYVDSDFSYVNNLLNIDFIDYQCVENILLGRIFTPIIPQDYDFTIDESSYVLTSNKYISIGKGENFKNFSQKLTFDTNFNLKQVVLEDDLKTTQLQIDYQNYIKQGEDSFPKNIKIFIKEKKQFIISLDYNKFEFIKMGTPFEIPKGYMQRKID